MNKWLVAGVASAILAAGIGVGVMIGLLAGSDGTTTTSPVATSTIPVQFSVAAPSRTTNEKAAAAGVGQPVTNAGVELTVTSASVIDSLPSKDGGAPPRPGAKLVRVDTTVNNVGQQSMDLTCGYPVANKVWDNQKRQFDAVHDLYKIVGNPKCNESLQPGFSAPMTYVYVVPADAQITFFGFADSNVNFGADTTFISLPIL